MRKLIGTFLTLSLLIGPVFASAQSTSANTQIQALLEQIRLLQAQIENLRNMQNQLQTIKTEISATVELIRNLREGMSGEDVATLQTILASDPEIYPEGIISGYYGKLTSEAVRKFQRKNGIEQVGVVGPKTLNRVNSVAKELGLAKESASTSQASLGIGQSNRLCVKVPPGKLIAPGWLKKNNGVAPVVPECQNLPPGIQQKLGQNSVVDTTAPVISTITATPSFGSATVNWLTNELSTTKVYYGTTTPDLNSNTTLSVGNNSLVLNHSINVTGLLPLTTYFYVVESKDASGNTATSTSGSFVTTATPDTTAPVISAVGTSNLLGTTTSIVWTTNEASDSKVWYGTTTPVTANLNNVNTKMASNSTLVTNHSLSLSDLATSTTYFYVVVSKDNSGNTATSTENSFVTTAGL